MSFQEAEWLLAEGNDREAAQSVELGFRWLAHWRSSAHEARRCAWAALTGNDQYGSPK
jgi:hypothetical protein